MRGMDREARERDGKEAEAGVEEAAGKELREGNRDEHVLDREHVGEEAGAAAGVVTVEVERRVGEEVKGEQRARRAHRDDAPGANDRHEDEQRERLEVRDVEHVHVQAAQRRAERGHEPVAVGEARPHEVAVLVEAADAGAESPPEAAWRPVADCIIHALR